MLKKINRISKESEIKEVLKNGRYLHDEFWMRKWINPSPRPAGEESPLDRGDTNRKFLIIISKKISKIAVDRNRMKRLAYEVIYKNLEKLPKGIRMVLVVKKAYEKIGDEIVGDL